MKKFAIGKSAQTDLLKALEDIAEAVGSTMGPGGRPFGFDKINADMKEMATFSKDGLITLRSLLFDDPVYQAVHQYCHQASSASVLESGDGTSSTLVLANAVAQSIHKSGYKFPQAYARKIQKQANLAIEEIRKESITGEDAVKKVALTSANGDEELAEVVVQAIKMSSAFGSILTVKNPLSKDRYKIDKQDGYSYCAGYNYNLSFATSAHPNASASKPIEWDDPYVAIFNGHLVTEDQVVPFLKAWDEACITDPKNLIIVAYEISDVAANKLLSINRKLVSKGVSCFVMRTKLTAEVNSGIQILRDIAAYCGVDEEKILDGGNYKKITPEFFGTCKKIKVTPMTGMFLGRADNHWVDKRIIHNQSIVEEARCEFDKKISAIRNAELAEGLVKVELGSGSFPDLQEREDRFDDASKAAQACMRSGALPGCGVSYIRAGILASVDPDLQEALSSIHHKVLNNYGASKSENNKIKKGHTYKILEDDSMVLDDALKLGVLDATETICSVIKNGVDLGVKLATIGGFFYRSHNKD